MSIRIPVSSLVTEVLPDLPRGDIRPALEPGKLFTVINDTRSRAWCGPTAVAAITGAPVSVVRDCLRLARFGSHWVDRPRSPPIMGTRDHEVEHAMRSLGFHGHWQTVPGNPTLAAFLESRQGLLRTHPTIIQVTRHYVAVSGWLFCDTFTKGEVVDADDAPGRRKRVKRVFIVTGRSAAVTDIPRK
ncbi:hypothetical protein [Sinorhizobium meliloti]|uniref:hypothetical protein n=1 Tax=Rhizobium meliloti TaxID=382 RepID=UPI000FDA00C0|nr:hypothetical protein [Sinorhizobium meliloti]RVP95803.1 hypothetical protein CN070_26935 [Sinorhizobium meliloti]